MGEVAADNSIEVIGIGTQPSRGLKKGVVVNIESTVQSIQRAIEEAELMAGCEIRSVFAGIAGSHVRSLNSHGVVAIRDREVSDADVRARGGRGQGRGHSRGPEDPARVAAGIHHRRPGRHPRSHRHVGRAPGSQGAHRHRRGVARRRTSRSASSAAAWKWTTSCCEQLASSFACLTDDETELGVCIIDIGGGTTDLAVFSQGAIRHTAVIPIAGDQVTNDIAVSMRTPTQYAEDIKVRYACALSQLANPDESIEVPSVGDRPARRLARQTLAEVVEPRYEELFGLAREELRRSGFEEIIAAGIVLTGGSAKMEGVVELAEEVFHVPVRLGLPQHIKGLSDVVRNPIYSTGAGLLLYARDNAIAGNRGKSISGNARSMAERMKNWFQGNF